MAQFVVKYRAKSGTKMESDTQIVDSLDDAITLVNNVVESSDKVLSLTIKTKREPKAEVAK